MLTLLSFMLAGPAHAAPAHAAPAHDHPLAVAAGVGSLAGPAVGDGLSAGGSGFVRVLAGRRALRLDIGGRTGLLVQELRETTTISAGLRWQPAPAGRVGPYGRLGLVHNHETPWDTLTASPLAAVAGTAEGIHHRSGGELAVGLSGTLLPAETDGRWSAFTELALSAFPDDGGPPLYGGVDVGLAYAFGPVR